MNRLTRSTLAWVSAATVILGACSGDDASDGSTSAVTRSSEPAMAPRLSDGVLRIGVLLPPEPVLDDAQRIDLQAVLEAAGRVIDSVGPPWIDNVELDFATESTDISRTRQVVNEFLDQGFDALIGPVSSDVAGTIVRDVTAAGVGVCSPASTSVLMAEVPDDGLLIRTAPGDDDIALAMTQRILGRGYSTAAVFYPETVYGFHFLDVIVQSMLELRVNITADGVVDEDLFFPYQPTPGGITEALTRVPALAPKIVLVIGDESVATEVATSFTAKDVLVNDGFAGASIPPADAEAFRRARSDFEGFAIDAFDGVDQTIASILALDSDLRLQTNGRIPLLTNFVDCLNVLVLASMEATSDLAGEFMPQAVAVTNRGSTCRTFAGCIEEKGRDLNIDYDGWGISLELDEGGQVIDGPIVIYELDPSGTMSFKKMNGVDDEDS